MCNRARFKGESETLWELSAELFDDRPRDNRLDSQELRPKGRAYVVRELNGVRGWDVLSWDVLGGKGAWPMTNMRNLGLPQWRALTEDTKNRGIMPLTEFCESTPDKQTSEMASRRSKASCGFR